MMRDSSRAESMCRSWQNHRRTNPQGLPYQVIVNSEGIQLPDLNMMSYFVRLFYLHGGTILFQANYLRHQDLPDEFLDLALYSFDTFRVTE